jgi:hypothetical protein
MQVLLAYPMQSLLRYPLQNMTYKHFNPQTLCTNNICNFCKNNECFFKRSKTFSDYINESVEKSLRLTFQVEKEEREKIVKKLILNEYSYIGKSAYYNSVTKAKRKVPKIYYLFYLGIGSLIFIFKFYYLV